MKVKKEDKAIKQEKREQKNFDHNSNFRVQPVVDRTTA
jgi:hypothetical protein